MVQDLSHLFLLVSAIHIIIYATGANCQPTPLTCTESTCEQPQQQQQLSRWAHLQAKDVSNIKLALLPLGSIENHGPHLPLGTDLFLAESISEQALDAIPSVALLPSSAYGASFEHLNKAGTLSVKDNVLINWCKTISMSLSQNGIRKVLLVNGHGGQTANVQIVIRHMRFKQNLLAVAFDVQAALLQAWKKVETRSELMEPESIYGIHGGLIETSVMLHLFPNLVDMSQAANFKPRHDFANDFLQPFGRVVSYGWKSQDICTEGAIGNAAEATSELGAAIFEQVVAELRAVVTETIQADISQVLELQK